jgi:hypothetical protein
MKVQISNNKLSIALEGREKLWSVKVDPININCDCIDSVSLEEPEFSWKTVRAPGTSVPWFFHAGTFYTPIGKEFWYFHEKKTKLTINLTDGPYDRIVISPKDVEQLYDQLLTLIT